MPGSDVLSCPMMNADALLWEVPQLALGLCKRIKCATAPVCCHFFAQFTSSFLLIRRRQRLIAWLSTIASGKTGCCLVSFALLCSGHTASVQSSVSVARCRMSSRMHQQESRCTLKASGCGSGSCNAWPWHICPEAERRYCSVQLPSHHHQRPLAWMRPSRLSSPSRRLACCAR